MARQYGAHLQTCFSFNFLIATLGGDELLRLWMAWKERLVSLLLVKLPAVLLQARLAHFCPSAQHMQTCKLMHSTFAHITGICHQALARTCNQQAAFTPPVLTSSSSMHWSCGTHAS